MVPNGFLGDSRVSSIMIEVNRGLYLENNSSKKSDKYASTHHKLNQLLTFCCKWVGLEK